MGSKNANVNDINGCTMVRTGMLRWLEPRNRNRPCRNGRLPRKKAPQPRPPPLINGTPPVVDLFLWTSNSPPYPPPQSEKPFSGGPENAPFPGRGGVGGGLGQTFSRLEPSPPKRKEGLSPPSPPPSAVVTPTCRATSRWGEGVERHQGLILEGNDDCQMV